MITRGRVITREREKKEREERAFSTEKINYGLMWEQRLGLLDNDHDGRHLWSSLKLF